MFTPRRTERVETWVEFSVPIRWGTGATWKDVYDAIGYVHDQYEADYGKTPSDDAIAVLVGDDEIILRYAKPMAVA